MVDATEGIDADRDPIVHNNNNNNTNTMFGENCSPNRFGGYGDGIIGDDTDQYGNWNEGWSGLPSDGDFFKNLKYDTDPGDEQVDDLGGGDDDGLRSYASGSASSSSAINFLAGLREDILPLPPPPPPPSSSSSSAAQSTNAPMEM